MSPLAGEVERSLAISRRIRPLSSAAAFLVNVMATVSVGSSPGHSGNDVRSLLGHLIFPIPLIDVRGGLEAKGSLSADSKVNVGHTYVP